MAKKRTGKNTQSAYKTEGRYAKNKRVKLERHLKQHPNNDQAREALKNIKEYSRKASRSKSWSSGDKWFAHIKRIARADNQAKQ